MDHPIAETFREAANLCRHDGRRKGNCLHFIAGEQIVYSGDIHGHRQNLARLIGLADLPGHPSHRLVLQELIHGAPDGSADGPDRSLDVLLRAARLKVAHPEQVFFVMGNHDMAQACGQEITKGGQGVCKAFDDALRADFPDAADEIRASLHDYLLSLPLAGRCENGLFMTHSLPAPNRMERMDWTILDRPYVPEDFRRGGSVYEWTWGRGHTSEQLRELAERLEAHFFLLGHQPVEEGYRIDHGKAVILSSNHARGRMMLFDAGARVTDFGLLDLIQPIVTGDSPGAMERT